MAENSSQIPATQDGAATPSPASVPLRRGSRLWAISAVFITGMVVFGGLAYVVIDTPRAILRSASGLFESGVQAVDAAMTPTVLVRQAIRSAIGDVRKEACLVVMTADVHVDVERSSEKRVLWDYLQLGTTTVRVRVPENHVQYIIPLDEFSEDNVVYDEGKNAIFLHLPSPILDERVVDVQSDRSQWMEETDVGWGRFDTYSGEHLRDQVYQSLREEVLAEGRHPLLMEKARTHGEQAVRALFEPYLRSVPETRLYVEFM